MTQSMVYFNAVNRGDIPDHSDKLNKMSWFSTEAVFPNSNIAIRVDPRMDQEVVKEVFSSVSNYFLATSTIKYPDIKLDIMYHKTRKDLGGQASALIDKVTNTLHAIIVINNADVLLMDDTLTHEMVHFWDYATQYSASQSWGSHECYAFDCGLFKSKNTKDKLLMAVDSVMDDIFEYINDPSERLVFEYFNFICDDKVESFERAHALSERVINTIDKIFKLKVISKKEAKGLMRYYISMLGNKNPKFKYLNQFARTTKAGRF
jgi:hypothetical protein